MFDFNGEGRNFAEKCTACGICVDVCPIVPMTDLKGMEPGEIMSSVLDVFRGEAATTQAGMRIYSCMSCATCRSHCPEGLDPGLGLSLARGILRQAGEPVPRGLAFLLPSNAFNFMKAVEAVQQAPSERPWTTNVTRQPPKPSKTVLFTGCTGIMQPDLVMTTLDLMRRADPTVQALGGVDYCCGDTDLRAGDPRASSDRFAHLVEGLNAFSPENVVFLCPTCKAFFDLHNPGTKWTGKFVTGFLAEHLDKFGPFAPVDATVTVHDACHLVRGEKPDLESPRALLKAIPGVKIIEMKDSLEKGLCCGGSAMAAVGKPGVDFRTARLEQGLQTGADILALYCPGCQSVFATERPNLPIRVESIITLMGESLGIRHEDKLLRMLSYHDADRVRSEVAERIEASELPQDKLNNFVGKYFR